MTTYSWTIYTRDGSTYNLSANALPSSVEHTDVEIVFHFPGKTTVEFDNDQVLPLEKLETLTNEIAIHFTRANILTIIRHNVTADDSSEN